MLFSSYRIKLYHDDNYYRINTSKETTEEIPEEKGDKNHANKTKKNCHKLKNSLFTGHDRKENVDQ